MQTTNRTIHVQKQSVLQNSATYACRSTRKGGQFWGSFGLATLLLLGCVPGVEAQIETAPPVFVDVDATALTPGNVNSITNQGSLGGFFQARGGATTIPIAARVDGGGTMG